jgi:hypothetical protein
LIGEWRGEHIDAQDEVYGARLCCKDWDRQLNVRGFEVGKQAWASWSVSERDPRIRPRMTLVENGEVIVTPQPDASDGTHEF